MFSGIYSHASAMDVASRQHDVIANNLANANAAGFRRTILAVSTRGSNEELQSGDVNTDLRGSTSARTYIDFTEGNLIDTGRKLDLAINGEGMFVIETPNGNMYTRNGNFHLSTDGRLVTADGSNVLGNGQALTVPADAQLSDIVINADGTVRAKGEEIGQLDLVTFDNLGVLQAVGDTRFRAPEDVTSRPAAGAVIQGSLESSNTSLVTEMIAMIIGMRHFEAAQQGLRSISEVIQQFTTFDS